MKERLRNIIVGYDTDDQPVTAGQLKAEGAMAVLLKDALKPNLVQTLEHTPPLFTEALCQYCSWMQQPYSHQDGYEAGEYAITEAGSVPIWELRSFWILNAG